eukprot:SAG22_NODE_164_length_16817_cov_61.573573_6_plen_90_part_00
MLGENQIVDITPLSSLLSLTRLGLEENQIANITPLGSLLSLTWLNLDENQIADITPLGSLLSLQQAPRPQRDALAVLRPDRFRPKKAKA